MRLGARWRVGDPPHPSVPESLHAQIAAQETAHPGATAWTLTWLEGRPRCDLEGRVVVTLSVTGDAVAEAPGADIDSVSDDDDNDDWLN